MKLGRLVQHWWIKLFGKFQVWSASHTRQPALAASSPLPSPSLTVSPHWPSRAGLVAHPRRRGSWVLTILSSTGAALLGRQHLPLAHAPSSVVRVSCESDLIWFVFFEKSWSGLSSRLFCSCMLEYKMMWPELSLLLSPLGFRLLVSIWSFGLVKFCACICNSSSLRACTTDLFSEYSSFVYVFHLHVQW